MPQSFWGLPVVVYLFLGGLSGGIAVACGVDCARRGAAHGRAVKACLWTSLASVAVGAAALALDLGRPLAAFTPGILAHGMSWISRGVWVIGLSAFSDLLLLLVVSRASSQALANAFPSFRRRRDALATGLSCVTAVLGCALALYTGFLLEDSTGVPFWDTPLLPLLFLGSSLVEGVCIFRSCAAATAHRDVPYSAAVVALFAGELVVLVVFLAWSWTAGSEFAEAAARTMLFGGTAPVFWIGVVGVGYFGVLLTRLLQGAAARRAGLSVVFAGLAATATCSMVGAFCLRWCVVFSAWVIA